MMQCYDLTITGTKERGNQMPKRKKLPVVADYIGLGNSEKLTVQKSTPLQSLAQSELTLSELKILDVYLSRIDSHDPEKRTVQLDKGELERVLGVTRIPKKELLKRLKHLFQAVEVRDETKPKGFKLVSLFEEADADPDETGLWTVTLTCTPSAREYIFNIENLGYLRYRLKNIVELKSRYSYILFMYLENNRFRKSWEIKLDDLKELMKCTAETYNAFFRFNGLILSKCHKELNEKTDCHFDYEPIKKNRTIVAVKFTMQTAKVTVKEVPEVPEATDPSCPLWESVLSEWKLPREKLDELAALLATIPATVLPQAEDTEQAKYKYIALKVATIKSRSQEKRITNRFRYLITMIENELSEDRTKESESAQPAPATARGTQTFRNFTERTNNNYMEKILKQYSQPLETTETVTETIPQSEIQEVQPKPQPPHLNRKQRKTLKKKGK